MGPAQFSIQLRPRAEFGPRSAVWSAAQDGASHSPVKAGENKSQTPKLLIRME